MDYCRVERRLAPMTCSAYERDVGSCIAFLEQEGVSQLREVGPAHLRRFLAEESIRRPAPSSQARGGRRAQGLLPLRARERRDRP
jgi:site-specific recombinase XerD